MSPVTQRRLRIASAVFFGLATAAGWLNVILADGSLALPILWTVAFVFSLFNLRE